MTLGALDFRRAWSVPLVRCSLRTRPSAATHGSALLLSTTARHRAWGWPRSEQHLPVEPLLSSAELALLSTGRLLSILVRAGGCATIVNVRPRTPGKLAC